MQIYKDSKEKIFIWGKELDILTKEELIEVIKYLVGTIKAGEDNKRKAVRLLSKKIEALEKALEEKSPH
jgi:hypothetical protein